MKRITAAPEEADIVDLTHEGQGVARIDGKTVFVADALPGERVLLRRTHRARNYDQAACEQVLVASADRVEPRCPHFGVCGGCALQHLSSEAQVRFKQAQLIENLLRIGGVKPGSVLEPLSGPAWGYRRRARLGAKNVPRKGRVLVGFRERSAPYLADLHECPVLASPVDRLIDPLASLVQSLSIPDRVPQVEVAVAEDACAMVLRVLDPLTDDDRARLQAFEVTHGVRLFLQPAGPDSIVPLGGESPLLHYSLPAHSVSIEFQPADFIQVNGALNAAMVDRAVSMLELEPGHSVLDLFCGLGNFSLPIARRASAVVAVEGDAALVGRARANAARNGIDNVAFHVADLFKDSSEFPWARREYDRVLLDPPRAGAREVLPIVDRSGARRVLYISCHPGSLARDAGILVNDHGFRLTAAGVMDMFPHTAHVEAMAVFDR